MRDVYVVEYKNNKINNIIKLFILDNMTCEEMEDSLNWLQYPFHIKTYKVYDNKENAYNIIIDEMNRLSELLEKGE